MFATAIALSTGVVAAAPAGAAGGTACWGVKGTAKFKPGLPQQGSKAKVKTAITITGAHISSCYGGGVRGGTLNANLKAAVAGNCASLHDAKDLKFTGTAKITWNSTAISTFATAQLLPSRRQGFVEVVLTGDVTGHKFAGSTLSVRLWFSGGGCDTGPMTSAKIRKASGTPLAIQ